MALQKPQIQNLARRMAMLNIEPEQLQKQIQPSLGLGDLSAPTAQAGTQVAAAGDPWLSGSWGSIGPFTPTEASRQQAEQVKQNAQNKKPQQGPMAPPDTAATRASKAVGAGGPTPSLGALMSPTPTAGAKPMTKAGNPLLSIAPPAPQANPATPVPTSQPSTPMFDIPGMTPLMPAQPLSTGPVNEGEKKTLAEGTMSQKELTDQFMQTLKTGDPAKGIAPLTNPMGLAAAMSTATHESAFAPANVFGKWNDPSEKGAPGTSGGSMSWRGPRYDAMQKFVTERGGDSVQNQALFFLQEDKGLISKLNNARDPAEAQQMMNQAWAFAGYDKPGNQEAQDRIATAQRLYSNTPLSQQDPGITQPPVMDPATAMNPTPMGGDGKFTMGDVDPTVTSAAPGSAPMQGPPMVDPLTQFPAAPAAPNDPNAWLQGKVNTIGKLGQLANAMKPPMLEPPKGTAPAPSQGSFNRDPNALKAIMAMLTNMGQSGGPPSLGMLMGGGR